MSTLGPYGPSVVKRLPINATGTGDMIIIPAEPGKRLIVFTIFFTSKKATVLTVKSGAINLISGPIEVQGNQALQLRDGHFGVFETLPGEPFVFNVTGAGHTIGGYVIYSDF